MKFIFVSTSMMMTKYKINIHLILFPMILLILILNMNFNFYSTNSFNLIMNFDILSMLLIILSMLSTTLIILSSSNNKKIYSMIYPIMLSLMMAFSMPNFFYFYIFFETVLIPTMFLITQTGNQPERLQASIYLIIYTITASLPLLICILLMKNNSSFFLSFTMNYHFKLSMLMMLAFLVKMPMFFIHLWLPKAHVEAPLEGSMILAAVLLKLGGYGMIRLIPLCMNNIFFMKTIIMSISMLGAFMTTMNCIRQKDMKSLIAYSSVTHMALTLSSILTINKLGLTGAIMMMMAHGLSSSALFLLVNDLYMKIHSRNIILFKGLLSLIPNINFWWFIFLALNMSAPPSINTLSEIFIMSSMLSWDFMMMLPITLTSFLAASFCICLFINISHNKNNMKFFPSSSPKLFLSLFVHSIPLLLILMKSEMMIM